MKVLYLGNRLSKHGFTPTGIEYLGALFEKTGFQVYYASDKKNQALRLLDMVLSVLRYKVDVILIDTYSSKAFYFAFICGCMAQAMRIPFIAILRGGDLPSRAKKSRRLISYYFRKAAKVVSVSRYLQNELSEYNTVYIPNTIDILKYPYRQRKEVAFRLLWVRSLHKVYNPDLAVRILHLLNKQFSDVTLTMVGPDKDGSAERVQKFACSLGIDKKLTLTGKLSKDDWISLSNEFDIFLNTTNFDNMPVSVIEAMALGLPVVSTSVGGVPYLITHEVDGLLVPPLDEVEFVTQIIRLRNNPGLVKSLTMNARRKVEHFDNKVVIQQWKDLIYEIIS